ncbi:GTP pyrophosphokinase family protein [Herbiconiux moechotypicola]|uniref:RelA/SpoT domain-containing protein n=1 Tax=Herbiconiux moechotypicola TaxID=637393 RepID=A0ABN3D9R5_9MICO|nr:GTP pyrophosphokinase family protein [Herbiconiux moechotypicola]MCS5729119.1 GTP pyrophosphokinase family protein [Herbiconiux moechotypicola]
MDVSAAPAGTLATRPAVGTQEMLAFAVGLRDTVQRLSMEHRFAVAEVETKVMILREEFLHLHRYNPIEHVKSRVKSPKSLIEKVLRKGCAPDAEAIRASIRDIAGVRVTCSFIQDCYRVLEALTAQDDLRVLEIKDYIAEPKANGYRSLHAIVEVPVFLSSGALPLAVEIQIRSVAQDFWASLEHKIFYKYDGEVPERLRAELAAAAASAAALDDRMEQLHAEVHGASDLADDGFDELTLQRLWGLAHTP